MRIYRHGRILDIANDQLFTQSATANGVVLSRTPTDNYARPRTPHVDCTTTNHTVSPAGYDDGTQTNRWVSVPARTLPQYIAGTGWRFVGNNAVQTSYNIPSNLTQYTARVVIPNPPFPINIIPRQWCLNQVEQDDIAGKTVCGTGIRWGNVFWGVGHYRIRCCSPDSEEESACLILVVGNDLQYFFPFWGNTYAVDITIQRLSNTLARVIAQPIGGGNPFTHTFPHTLQYTHPFRAEYYVKQISLGCPAPDRIEPYHIQNMVSPALVYQYQIPIPLQHLHRWVFVQAKTVPDPFTTPNLTVKLHLMIDQGGLPFIITINYNYNPEANLWEPEYPIPSNQLPNVNSATIDVSTNQILERVSVMIGDAQLYYTPAPHQVEHMAVVPIEMEQTGIPSGIIPSGYTVIGIPDYARVLSSGTISVLPAQYARIMVIHLLEKSV